jgi:hypothetical protein
VPAKKTEVKSGFRNHKEQAGGLENALDTALCSEDGAEEKLNCKHNHNEVHHQAGTRNHLPSRPGLSRPAPVDKTDVGRRGHVDEKGPERGNVGAGAAVAHGTSVGSRGAKPTQKTGPSILTAGGSREGKAIQSPRVEDKFVSGQRSNEAATNGQEDIKGRPAVLAARDDRQMEEFRAAKHFNCTGRGPGLYADVNTGCKVRYPPPFLFCIALTHQGQRKKGGRAKMTS